MAGEIKRGSKQSKHTRHRSLEKHRKLMEHTHQCAACAQFGNCFEFESIRAEAG